ncbi:MAG: hypothetical protein ACMUIS_09630 [bacterium]
MNSRKTNRTHSPRCRCNQDGVVLVFTLFLLLIISILTIAFLYLQFIEVDLIASETKYLQTFYLASAGLEKGKRVLDEVAMGATILDNLKNSPYHTYSDPSWETPVMLDSHVSGTYKYRYILSSTSTPYKITVQGIGTINGSQRRVERTFTYSSRVTPPPPPLWPPEFPDYPDVQDALDNCPSTVRNPLLGDLKRAPIFIYADPPQPDFLTNSSALADPVLAPYGPRALSQAQLDALQEWSVISKNKIAVARNIKENVNEKLLYDLKDPLRIYYESPYLEEIDSYAYSGWRYDEFEYIERRTIERKGTIITPTMVVNENKSLRLEPGTYFFDSLTLKQGATITTNGNVEIRTAALKLEKGARLIGGSVEEPNPLKLIVLGEYWTGYPYDSTKNNIKIGAGATVYGHIFATNMTVYLTQGTSFYGGDTQVHGSLLANRLVTVAENDSGVIKIIYEGTAIPDIEEDAGTWREVKE